MRAWGTLVASIGVAAAKAAAIAAAPMITTLAALALLVVGGTVAAAPRGVKTVMTLPLTQDAWGLLPPRPADDATDGADDLSSETPPKSLAELLGDDFAAGLPVGLSRFPMAAVLVADLLPRSGGEELLLHWPTGMLALVEIVEGDAGGIALPPAPRLVCASPLPLGLPGGGPRQDDRRTFLDAGNVRVSTGGRSGPVSAAPATVPVVAVLSVRAGERLALLQLLAPPSTAGAVGAAGATGATSGRSGDDGGHSRRSVSESLLPFALLAEFDIELIAPLHLPALTDADPRLDLLRDLDGDGVDELLLPFSPAAWLDLPVVDVSALRPEGAPEAGEVDGVRPRAPLVPHRMPAPANRGSLEIQGIAAFDHDGHVAPSVSGDGGDGAAGAVADPASPPRVAEVSVLWMQERESPLLEVRDWTGDGVADLFFRESGGEDGPQETAWLYAGARIVADRNDHPREGEDGAPDAAEPRLHWDGASLRLVARADRLARRSWHDLDGDALPDVVAMTSNLDVAAPRTRLTIFAGADQPRDGDTITYRVPSQVIRSRDAVGLAIFHDFDGDARPDLALSNLAYVFGSVSDFAEAMLAEQITMGLRFHRGIAGRGAATPAPLFEEVPWTEVEYPVEMGAAGGEHWFVPGGDYDGDGADELILSLSRESMGMLAVDGRGARGPLFRFGPVSRSWLAAPLDSRAGDELMFLEGGASSLLGVIFFE
jgi:hypothetical protein